jgi:YYY domain-containing protein
MLWGLAYASIYTRPHPAAEMAAWIGANVPGGASIAKEHWEEGLPNLGQYRLGELNLYDADDVNKLRAMATTLANADYLLFYSNRLYGTIPRLPERYPMTTEYYRRLFSGELGFTLVHAEANYPSLAGVAFMDNTFVRPGLPVPSGLDRFLPSPRVDLGFADESYSVYDHPLVLLFQRTASLTPAQIEQQLAPYLPPPGMPPPSAMRARSGSGLMLPPAVAAADWAGGTWSAIFPEKSLPSQAPVLFWLLAIEAIGLLALPLAVVAGRALPDRGFFLAKPLGLLLVAWLVFLAASIRVVPFERWSILLALGVVAAASGVALARDGRRILQDLRDRQSTIIAGQIVFFVAFLAFVWLRTLNPDLWHPARGGEKPMDLAYLTAVTRSTYFPAYDPWFAGGYLNYYYFGQVIVATVIKLTGIVPEVAYNLAVATLFALTAALAFSIVANLARAGQAGERSAWLGGLAAAVFVCVAGNLDGIAQFLDGLRAAGVPAVQTQLPVIGGALQAWSGLTRIAAGEATMPTFDFWRSSRMMPPQISITEFPYFTFLFADLHAHLIALPFTLLAIGLALAFALGGRGIVLLLLLALATGMLRPANTWDYPTYTALAIAAMGIGFIRHSAVGLVWNVAWRAAVVLAVGYLAFLPYHQSYELFYSGVELSKETTPLHQYLAVHGLFLFLGVSWLVYEIARQSRGTGVERLAMIAARSWDRLPRVLALAGRLGRAPIGAAVIGVAALVVIALVLALLGLPTPAFVLLIVVPAGLLALRRFVQRDRDSPRDLFVLALFGLGLALGAVVDLVTVQGDIARMNTVFKFYLQAWVLLALVAGYAFWRLALAGPITEPATARAAAAGRVAWTAALAVLLGGALIYPVAATPVRLRDRFQPLPPTLDGTAFMASAVYQDERGPIELRHDLEAIRWLRENLEGTPIIVEGVTPFYRWGSRISIYTGLPTVVGWDWHQKQQRWDYQQLVDQRIAEVNAFYAGTDPNAALAFLNRYGVRYVIVGTVERNYYPRTGLAKFDQMTTQLEPVYKNAGTTIYRVKA